MRGRKLLQTSKRDQRTVGKKKFPIYPFLLLRLKMAKFFRVAAEYFFRLGYSVRIKTRNSALRNVFMFAKKISITN